MAAVAPPVRLQITVADEQVMLAAIQDAYQLLSNALDVIAMKPPPPLPSLCVLTPPHAVPCQAHQKEVIRRVTKSSEVVEVDGFLFKRKRRGTVSAPPMTTIIAAEVDSPAAAQRDQPGNAGAVTDRTRDTKYRAGFAIN